MDGLMAKKLSDTEIAQMFADYVTRMEDRERHTGAAVKEADAFDTFLESEFPRNIRLQTNLYDRMMNTAVEYEESGFIAGFKTAMALLSGQEELLPAPTQITTPKAETSQQEAVTKTKEEPMAMENFITTIQIAELFGQRNDKVCARIEKRILPFLDNTSKAMFEKKCGRTKAYYKPAEYYKMNQAACKMYLDVVEPGKAKFINIAGGYAKLQELMQNVFPAEEVPFPA